MAQKTSPAQRPVQPQAAGVIPRTPGRRLTFRQRWRLRALERQLVGRRRRFSRRAASSAPRFSADDLQALIAAEVQKAVDAQRESISRETEEEIELRMEEFTEMMLSRQEKMMARAWQQFSRRARQRRQRTEPKS